MRRFLLVTGLTVAVALAAETSASACTCGPIDVTGERPDAAVVAKLVSVKVLGEDPRPGEPVPLARPANFRFRLIEVIKGRKRIDRKVISVRSNTAGSACGMPQRIGRRYGLVLDRRKRRWHGSLCGTTTPKGLRDLFAGERRRLRCSAVA